MGNMKYYYTRIPIYNEYRWYCLYIDYKGVFISAVHVPTGILCTNSEVLSRLHSIFTEINVPTKIKRWEI